MQQEFILHIETSGDVCGVAISRGEELIGIIEENAGRSHAEKLHVFIDNALKQCRLSPNQLQAISVNSGPGSFTGLRIGTSTAKGICFSLNIPLIAVSSTVAITNAAIDSLNVDSKFLFFPMIDARRMEVYGALYNQSLNSIWEIKAYDLNDIKWPSESFYFYGNGSDKAQGVLNEFSNAHHLSGINFSAKHLINPAYKLFCESKFEELMDFEPLYGKGVNIAGKIQNEYE